MLMLEGRRLIKMLILTAHFVIWKWKKLFISFGFAWLRSAFGGSLLGFLHL